MKQFTLLLPYAFILLATAVLLRTFLHPGIPQSHDGNNHLARMANFYLVIHDHQFPPRWAPNLNYRFGYPVFHYMHYLAYIPAIMFYSLGTSLEVAYKLVVALAIFAGGVGVFRFLRYYIRPLYALAGAILYLTAPPQLLQIYVRGNIGETVAWAIMPLVLWSLQAWITAEANPNRSISYAQRHQRFVLSLQWLLVAGGITTLILAHSVIMIFGLPILFTFGLVLTGRLDRSFRIKILYQLCLAFILGIGMAAFFWLPALLENSLITLSTVSQTTEFYDHFVRLKQLVYSPWGYGYSTPGEQDTLSFQLGLVLWTILIAGSIKFAVRMFGSRQPSGILPRSPLKLWQARLSRFWYTARSGLQDDTIGVFWASIWVITIFAMTSWSKPVWQFVPFLMQIQFTWRLLFATTLAMVICAAFILDKWGKPVVAVLAVIIAVGLSVGYAKPQGYHQENDYLHFEFPFTSSVMHELMPIGFDMYKNSEYKPRLADTKGLAQFQEQTWQSNLHRYTIEASGATTVIEHLAYFPGWKTSVDQQPVAIQSNHPDYPGVVTFKIQPGFHQVETIWTEDTPARKWGDGISLCSIMIGIGYVLFRFLKGQ